MFIVRPVVDGRQMFFGNGHAHAHRETLAQRARRHFDAVRIPHSGCPGVIEPYWRNCCRSSIETL